jgi:3-dehydroquinate synthase II
MKSAWIKITDEKKDHKRNKITTAIESGVDFVWANAADISEIKQLGKIQTACFYEHEKQAPDADVWIWDILSLFDSKIEKTELKRIEDAKKGGKGIGIYANIQTKEMELYAAEIGKIADYLIITANDWRIIPLENLIAALEKYDVEIITDVHSAKEAQTALVILEKGTDGVLIESGNLSEIKEIALLVKSSGQKTEELTTAVITKIQHLGMGDRVCIDTCNLMVPGEGMLIGSQSAGLFLIHSEVDESPYVASRPFRVNAGAVYSYLKVDEKTRYLSELKAGDDVMIIDCKGQTRPGIVGRVKIESRPMILLEAEASGKIMKVILQNAETVKLVRPDGKSISITQLKVGDEVLVKIEEAGRHFGMKVTEKIIEN